MRSSRLVFRGWLAFVFLPLAMLPASAQDGDEDEGMLQAEIQHPTVGPVPEHPKVSLLFDRKKFVLGDEVAATFRLENAGKAEFLAYYGGDGDFPTRCKVTVTDAEGKNVRHWPDLNGGGAMMQMNVKPGDHLDQTIPIARYVKIDKPGRYTVTVTHDFGWTESGGRKFPTATGEFEIVLPTAAEAAVRVAKATADKEWHPELMLFTHPVYLPALQKAATSGSETAAVSIAGIETPEATAALLELADVPDPAPAQAALSGLEDRVLPRNADGSISDMFGKRAAALAKKTWDPKFDKVVHDLAVKLLAREDPRQITVGAVLMRNIGKPDDMAFVAPALRRALQRDTIFFFQNRRSMGGLDDSDPPLGNLVAAADQLRRKGYRVTPNKDDDAAMLLYFLQLGDPGIPRPDGWEKFVADAVLRENMRPMPVAARQAALRAIPLPLADGWLPAVAAAMGDNEPGVVFYACLVARDSGRPELIKPLLQTLEGESDPRIIRLTSDAAWKLGSRLDVWKLWAEKLTSRYALEEARPTLCRVIAEVADQPEINGSTQEHVTRDGAFALRETWRKFLRDHGDELAAGKRFSYKDPLVRPLMGTTADGSPIYKVTLPDHKNWPE